MSAAKSTRLRGRTRWSAAAKCPRWAAMGLLGYEAAEPSERTQGMWLRGKMFGTYIADLFAIEHGEENVIREKAVPWPANGLPLGELHTDVYVAPERMAVEIKSTTAPSSLRDDALTQLAGEVHFDPDADIGALAFVNPVDMSQETDPFLLTDQWVERVEEIASLVAEAGRTRTLPDCSACSPTECHFKGCPYTAEAWKDWTPPDPQGLDGEAAELVREMYALKLHRAVRKEDYEAVDGAYRDICDRLAAKELEPGVPYEVGPLVCKRSAIAGRETFSLTRARKTGLWNEAHDELFGPFVKLGDGYDLWSVERVGDGPVATKEQFGDEVPF